MGTLPGWVVDDVTSVRNEVAEWPGLAPGELWRLAKLCSRDAMWAIRVMFVESAELPRVIALLRTLRLELDPDAAVARAERDGMFVGRWDGMRIDVFLPSIPFARERDPHVGLASISKSTQTPPAEIIAGLVARGATAEMAADLVEWLGGDAALLLPM